MATRDYYRLNVPVDYSEAPPTAWAFGLSVNDWFENGWLEREQAAEEDADLERIIERGIVATS